MEARLVWGINPPFGGLSPCPGQVAYALRTRAPVAVGHIAMATLPLDLHVLGLSLAFILSQDQTLRCMTLFICIFRAPGGGSRRSPPRAGLSLALLFVRLSQYVNVLCCLFGSAPLLGPPTGCEVSDFRAFAPNLFSTCLPSFRDSGCKGRGKFWICKGWRGIFFIGRGYGGECQGVGRGVNLG